MSEQDALQLKIMLLKRRQEIFEQVSRLEAGWQTLGERDVELEEEAQKVDISSLYELLDERGKQEIEEIDLALCRIAVGTYGICEECEQRIPARSVISLPRRITSWLRFTKKQSSPDWRISFILPSKERTSSFRWN